MVSNNIREEIRRQVEEAVGGAAQQTIQNVTLESQITRDALARIEALESEIKQLKQEGQEAGNLSSPEFNYHTRGTYEGSEVRFALQGEVLTPQDAAQYGDVNYIEFGGEGSGGDYAFRLFPTTTDTTPPQPRVGVVYGEVNKIAPTNINSLFSPANNGLLWLRITFATNGAFQGSSIQTGSSLPANTPTNLHVLIGRVILEDSAYTVNRQTLLGDIIVRRYNVCENGDPKVDYIIVANEEAVEL